MSRPSRIPRLRHALAGAGALAASAITAHTWANLRHLRTPSPDDTTGTPPTSVTERVSILLPVRNEALRVAPTLRSLLNQRDLDDMEILVLDDGSTDDTAEVVRETIGVDPRVKIIDGGHEPLPPGWLGKPWACHRLSLEASGSILVFIDADVTLHPTAIATTIRAMRDAELDLISPYPRQLAETWPERITQPLVVWSWIATLPLRIAENTHYPSMAAANGQFICVDARAYRISGGHTAVASLVVEDVAVLRTLKRHGFRGAPANGGLIAECRMYEGAQDIYEGYTKSLWSVFGSRAGAAAVVSVMVIGYIAPPLFAAFGRDRIERGWGVVGYGAGVLGRVLVARRTGERRWPDALTQPASVTAFAALTIASFRRRRQGTLQWRGRILP